MLFSDYREWRDEMEKEFNFFWTSLDDYHAKEMIARARYNADEEAKKEKKPVSDEYVETLTSKIEALLS
jgi:hypothetical protein